MDDRQLDTVLCRISSVIVEGCTKKSRGVIFRLRSFGLSECVSQGKSSPRAAGKINLFYSPSQEGVQHFFSQERATRIFSRMDVFAWSKKRG